MPALASSAPSPISFEGAVQADLGAFPSGFGENGLDLMAAVHPVIAFAVGEDFGIALGPTFRFRLLDTAPSNWPSDAGQVLRGADWDELSDFGQIVESLWIGPQTGRLRLRLGPARKKSLGLGHLLWRYSNRNNADYHPASGQAALGVGPVDLELFASDILGARLFVGELTWDLGSTFSAERNLKNRFLLAFELAHDANLAARPFRPDPGAPTPAMAPVTLLHLDASAVLVRSTALRWMVMLGGGARADVRFDLGFLMGTTLDATLGGVGISTRLELRKQKGGFRQGYFGPMYELQRFVDVGFSGPSLGDATLPDGFSGFAELRVGLGARMSFDAAAEYFSVGRLDLDGGLSLALLDEWLLLSLRTTLLGLAQAPRYGFSGSLRARLFPSFYVTAEGGTLFFPQVDGSLVRGVAFSAGVGVDFQR